MDSQKRRNTMAVNLSNVFSPQRRLHVSDHQWDVDFTELGNPMVESHYESAYPGNVEGVEKDGANDINRDDSLM